MAHVTSIGLDLDKSNHQFRRLLKLARAEEQSQKESIEICEKLKSMEMQVDIQNFAAALSCMEAGPFHVHDIATSATLCHLFTLNLRTC